MDVFDLVAKIRLDKSEYEKGVGDAKGTFSELASGVGKGLLTVAKVGAAAVSAGVAGVAALTKMGVQGYAQYEQLKGGVETLFKDSADAVKNYAKTAYIESGLSANQYMETVTSFSASLIQSLDGDTARAAEVANTAIVDMSDNANKMGTDIGMLQNAYNGFAKGNFTMLDNLKLGYGGTKSEMERLLKDAEKLPEAMGRKFDLNNYADVVEAIHLVQEEMGIAGTTAEEAATTIEGSLGMMKGAWENLVVGMADENANMEELINNFVDSAGIAAENLIPRIEQTLLGIGTLIEKLAPIIAEALPKVIESVLPQMLVAGVTLISAIVEGLITAAPAIYEALLEAVYIALTTVFGMSEESARKFVDGIDTAVRTVVKFISDFVTNFRKAWNDVWSDAVETANETWNTITATISGIVEGIKGFFAAMVQKGKELVGFFKDGVQTKFAEFLTAVGGWVTDNIITPITDMGTDLYNAGVDLLGEFWDGLTEVWDKIEAWWDGLTFSEKDPPNPNDEENPKATGLDYVPFDGYRATLHRGEAILTAAEARVWRKNGLTPAMAGGGVTINQYIQTVPQTPVEFANATEAYFEQARWTL